MPLKKCTKDGKSGWQYGNQTWYTGPDGKKKAIRQMVAIKISQEKAGKSTAEVLSPTEFKLVQANFSQEEINALVAQIELSGHLDEILD